MKKLFVILGVMLTNVFEAAFVTPFLHEPATGRKMAKVKFSALISEMRNKLNGSVFSKNRGGNYLRNKVTPVNPQTSFQSLVRSYFTSLSQQWRTLTSNQRLAWEGAVANFAGTDIFGDIKNPSGINLFVKLNMNLLNIGEPVILVPPALSSSPGIADIIFAVYDISSASFNINGNLPVPAGMSLVIEATPPVSPGKSFLKNLYTKIEVIPAATAAPYDIVTLYNAKYGVPAVGMRIGVRAKLVDTVTGVAGQYTQVFGFVQA